MGERAVRTYQVPALEKGLDILERLSAERIPLSLSDLARALGRTTGEIFRMLVLLERRGYVLRDPSNGRYALSLRLYAMARAHNPLDHLIRAAQPGMQRLAEATRESCHLAVCHRGELLVAARAEAPTPIRLSVEVGATFDPALTTSGRLILAMTGRADRAGAETAGAGPLHRAASRGWLAEPSLSYMGVYNLAVAIPLPAEPAALTIVWIPERGSARSRTEELLNAAQACAAEISGLLGLAGIQQENAA